MNAWQKYRFCFIAGLCAAGGSVFGKLPSLLKDIKIPFQNASWQSYCAFILIQCLPIVFMVISNLLNWRYFLKALQMSEQTLIPTVLTAASNYMISFLFGFVIFKEPVSPLSVVGSTFIILGLWCLCADKQSNEEKSKKI